MKTKTLKIYLLALLGITLATMSIQAQQVRVQRFSEVNTIEFDGISKSENSVTLRWNVKRGKNLKLFANGREIKKNLPSKKRGFNIKTSRSARYSLCVVIGRWTVRCKSISIPPLTTVPTEECNPALEICIAYYGIRDFIGDAKAVWSFVQATKTEVKPTSGCNPKITVTTVHLPNGTTVITRTTEPCN